MTNPISKVNLITYPDQIFSDTFKILFLSKNQSLKDELQSYIANSNLDTDIYLMEDRALDNKQIDWLFNTFNMSNICVLDLDSANTQIRQLASYFIAKPKTYYLTNEVDSLYNHISNRQVYNLDFLHQIGGNLES
jgi:hypothetical protein